MLPPSDRAVCERDPALPGLATVLDAEALRRLAGRSDLSPVYLRYKPGTSCVAGLAAAGGGPVAFAVLTYPPGRRYREVRERPSWQAGPDPVRFHDDLCLAIVPASRDRRLKAARALADPDRGVARLAERVEGTVVGLTLLRYKPGRRLVLRLDGAAGPLAILKAYGERDFEHARLGAAHAAALGSAPLLAEDGRRRSLATGWIAGRSLCPTVSGPPDAADLRATGAVLARLHREPLRPPRRLDRDAEAQELAAAAAALVSLRPELARLARRLAAAVADRLRALPFAPVLLHGDFSADQVILRGGEPTLIDWDRIALGDPARDLGSFLARLDVQAIDGEIDASEAEAAGEALIEGYAGAAGAAPGALAAEQARALLALATEGFRLRRADWPQRAEAILARAEAALGVNGSAPAPTPGLGAALDAGAMRPRLAEALGTAPEALGRLDIRLLRHKPGRRALIRYAVATPPDGVPPVLLGKLRAKGLDRRTPALHAALRAAGLDGRPPHGVGVPASLGAVEAPALWLQEALPGRVLTDLLHPGEGVAEAARTGRALARLHDAPVAPARDWTMADEIAVLDRALDEAGTRLPRHRRTIAAIAEGARAAARGLGEGAQVGLHRDFHPDQVLIDGGRIWLLDLDLHARGDAAIDLGNFVAHLMERGLRLHGDADTFDAHAEAFLGGYEALRGATDRARVRALVRISLARHVQLSQALPGRSHTTEPLIALSAEVLCAASAPGARRSA